MSNCSFSAALLSWLSGLFLMVSTALFINSYLHAKWKQAETSDSQESESQEGARSPGVAKPFFRRPSEPSQH
jgi:hypothetical protein